MTARVVIDTNVFVAAGFNARSASARILDRVRERRLRLVWNIVTQAESRRILQQIPRLSWRDFEPLFRPEDQFLEPTDAGRCGFVRGSLDREFLALAEAAEATLITSDGGLLGARRRAAVAILPPQEFLQSHARGE